MVIKCSYQPSEPDADIPTAPSTPSTPPLQIMVLHPIARNSHMAWKFLHMSPYAFKHLRVRRFGTHILVRTGCPVPSHAHL